MMMWSHNGAEFGIVCVLQRLGLTIVALLLHFPFVSYHIANHFARRMSGELINDTDPDDEFSRALAVEKRGDARGAVERYSLIIKDDPLHTEARLRLANLLARSRRLEQAKDVIRTVMKTDELPDRDRAELAALLAKLESGNIVDDSQVGNGRQVRQVTTARIEAHAQQKANDGGSDPSIPVE